MTPHSNVVTMPSPEEREWPLNLKLSAAADDLARDLHRACGETYARVGAWDDLTTAERGKYRRAALIALRSIDHQTDKHAHYRGAMDLAVDFHPTKHWTDLKPLEQGRYLNMASTVIRGFERHFLGHMSPMENLSTRHAYDQIQAQIDADAKERGALPEVQPTISLIK